MQVVLWILKAWEMSEKIAQKFFVSCSTDGNQDAEITRFKEGQP